MAEYEFLLYDLAPTGVATVTLNRPDRLNAMTTALMDELSGALKAGEKDPAVKVFVIKGAGKCFSSGYDFAEHGPVPKDLPPGSGPADGVHEKRGVPEFGRGVWNSRARVQEHIAYEKLIWDLWKPVIAQVHGHALGAASTLALVCDLTIMADSARIGYPPTRWLATGDTVGIYSFMAGLKKAKELAFGELFTGQQAVEIGMANYSFPEETLEEETLKIASRVATIDSELLMLNKSMVNRVWESMGFKNAQDLAGEFESLVHLSNIRKGFKAAIEEHGSLGSALKALNAPWEDR